MTKILLVEDDKSLREIYGVRLLAEGYDIVSAGDGEEALAMVVKEMPDLILSDVMMPRVSGFDMLDILRANPPTRGIKVIMMTALSSEDQRQRGEQLGANKYLVKSQVGIEDVVKAVHEVLGDAHLSAEERKEPSSVQQPQPVNSYSAPAPTPAPQQGSVDPVNFAPVQPVAQNPTQQQSLERSQQQQVLRPAPTFSREMPSLQAPSRPQAPTAQSVTQPHQMPSQPLQTPAPAQVNAQPQAVAPSVSQQQFQPQPAPATQPQQVTVPQSQELPIPQPTAPFSTDRPSGFGERIIQPPVQTLESERQEAEFAAQLDSVLGNTNSNPINSDLPQPPFGAR